MLVLLSPAKSLDYDSALPTKKHTKPRMLDDSEQLVEQLRKMTASQLGSLMSISEKLSELNAERYMKWEPDFSPANSRQALFAFTGDVYQGMELAEWSAEDFTEAQKKVRILSGLYGVLRPLDLMQAYRLEMGTKLENARGKNLYAFWGSKITDILNHDLKASGSDLIVNLASNEYFSSVKKKELNGRLITPAFKDEKNGKYKVISFYAKKARGMMADYIIRNNIEDVAGLKKFKSAGYSLDEANSSDSELVFLRAEKKEQPIILMRQMESLCRDDLERNIRLFVWFRVLFNARFYYPVFAVFFTDMGLSVSQFLWLNTLWAVTIVVFELPSGVLADLVGRRKLVLFSAVSMLVEMLLLIVAPQGAGWWLFGVCAANRILSGMAEAAASGADEALAYDSVSLLYDDELKRASRWDDVLVATMRWRSLAMVIAMLVGAFVFDHQRMTALFGEFPAWLSLKLPIFLCFISSIFCVVFAWRLTDLGIQKKSERDRTHVSDIWLGVLAAIHWVASTKWIAAIIIGGVIIDAAARNFVTLQSTYFQFIGLPAYAWGIVGAGMSLSGWVVPLYVKRLAESFSPRVNFLLAGGVSFIGLLGVARLHNFFGILPSFLVMLSLVYVGFLLSRYINKSAPSERRASILSVNSLMINLGYGGVSLALGLAMNRASQSVGETAAFGDALEWLAIGLLLGLLIWFVASRPFRK